ncbi:hypothetical protein SK128_001901 [Halocaridina rubra]|uniref:Uncharacterized protein n=1 Tax=Halocaridina rubra TaxID=373956 RepID=A0AAN8XJM9_HALRR
MVQMFLAEYGDDVTAGGGGDVSNRDSEGFNNKGGSDGVTGRGSEVRLATLVARGIWDASRHFCVKGVIDFLMFVFNWHAT